MLAIPRPIARTEQHLGDVAQARTRITGVNGVEGLDPIGQPGMVAPRREPTIVSDRSDLVLDARIVGEFEMEHHC